MTGRRFYSRVDPWVAAVPALITAFVMWRSYVATGSPFNAGGALVMLAAFAWIYTSTHYTFEDGILMVRCGPLRRRVGLLMIKRVRPTRTWLSAPALSLDRLEISGGHGVVVISPSNRAEFLAVLKKAAPQAQFEV